MKLYELLFRHYAPKDSEEGIICYLVADTDEEVYEYIKSEPTIPDGTQWGINIFNSWKYKDDEEDSSYDSEHKARLIECHGEMFDDCAEISDLYYGLTHYGWKCVCDDISDEQVTILQNCGVITVYTNPKMKNKMQKCISKEPLNCLYFTKETRDEVLKELEPELGENDHIYIVKDDDKEIAVYHFGYCRNYYFYNHWYVKNYNSKWKCYTWKCYTDEEFKKHFQLIGE